MKNGRFTFTFLHLLLPRAACPSSSRRIFGLATALSLTGGGPHDAKLWLLSAFRLGPFMRLGTLLKRKATVFQSVFFPSFMRTLGTLRCASTFLGGYRAEFKEWRSATSIVMTKRFPTFQAEII